MNRASVRVLVVDDSAFMRRAISSLLAKGPGIEVIDTARNGVEAIEKARTLRPDLITLDVEMPEMDGITVLRLIKRVCSARVILVSSLTTQGARATLRGLALGADDYLANGASTTTQLYSLGPELIAKAHALTSGRSPVTPPYATAPPRPPSTLVLRAADHDLLVIGSSTGGPPVLEHLLAGLPADFALPLVIAQHMPEPYTRCLAERLGSVSPLMVHHGEHGISLEAGHVYVAQGGRHTMVRRQPGASGLRLETTIEPRAATVWPSVDALFATAAASAGRRALALVLAGMGQDGLEGGKLLHATGATILVQDEASCVVYEMPKAVVDAGIAAASASPDDLVAMLRTLRQSTSRSSCY